MITYKIELVAKGPLTQLPDSQKIFGALVYLFSEQYGSDKATRLTKDVLDKNIHLALSNVIPAGYLPVPQDYLIDKIAQNAYKEDELKQKRTAIKKRSYVKPEDINRICQEPESCEKIFPYVKLETQQQLRASIESSYYGIPVLDNQLYSVPTLAVLEINQEKKELKKPVHAFCFYLQADSSETSVDLLSLLEEAVAVKRIVILGKRSSQGLNTFELVKIAKHNFAQSTNNLFLNMGMLLPNKIDFQSSTLRLFTSERRPLEMPGGWNQYFTKQFISFIGEGSIIKVPDSVTEVGKSVPSHFNKERDIVFGNAFLYPIL